MYKKHGGYVGEKEIVDYSININPLGVSTALKEELCKNIDEIERYPQIDGKSTKEKLSGSLDMDIENLILGNGATELIYLFSRALDIKKAIVVEPTFTEYEKSVEIIGGEVIHFLLEKDDFSLDVEKLVKAAEDEKPDAIYICSPNNPTGKIVTKDDIIKLLETFKKTDTYLFLDESFLEFSDIDSCIELLELYEMFVLRSITKIYGVPGIRIGYGAGSRDIVKQMSSIKEPWSVNYMALKTMETYLQDDEYMRMTEQWYQDEKNSFLDRLSEIDYLELFESGANFVLCRLKSGNSNELQEYMVEKGFYIRTCEDFYGLDDSYIRLAVRKTEENRALVESLKSYRGGDSLE